MKEISAALPSHLTAEVGGPAPRAKNAMGKDDFMKLLMAQLQNQDPLKPVDHHEFVAQLAQFGSLEQLTNIHKGIEGLHEGMGDDSKLSAIGFIGKRVQAAGSQVDLIEGQGLTMRYTRKEGLTPVRAQVYTEGGKLVREMDINSKGDSDGVKWDGKDTEGKQLPSGRYTFRVQGVDTVGQAQEMGTELSGRVTGVDMEGKVPQLIVQTATGTTRIELTKIRNVEIDDAKNTQNPVQNLTAPKAGVTAPVLSKSLAAVQPSDAEVEAPESEPASEPEAGAIASTQDLDRMWTGIPNFVGSIRE